DEFVGTEIRIGTNNVHGLGTGANRVVVGLQDRELAVAGRELLRVNGPAAVVVAENGDVGNDPRAAKFVREFVELTGGLSDFGKQGFWLAIGTDERAVKLLLAI